MIPKIVIIMDGGLIESIYADTHIEIIQINKDVEDIPSDEPTVLYPSPVLTEPEELATAWKSNTKDNDDYGKFNPNYVNKVFKRVIPQINKNLES